MKVSQTNNFTYKNNIISFKQSINSKSEFSDEYLNHKKKLQEIGVSSVLGAVIGIFTVAQGNYSSKLMRLFANLTGMIIGAMSMIGILEVGNAIGKTISLRKSNNELDEK